MDTLLFFVPTVLEGRLTPHDMEQALHGYSHVSVAMNPRGTTFFVTFPDEPSMRVAWTAAKDRRIQIESQALKVKAKDENVQRQFEAFGKLQEALTLLFFVPKDLVGRVDIGVMDSALRAAGITASRLSLNPAGNTFFARFADEATMASAWRVAKEQRLKLSARAVGVKAADATMETTFASRKADFHRALPVYQDLELPFWQIMLQMGVCETPYFELVNAPQRPMADRVAYVNAWKALLFEECRAQIWDGVQRSDEARRVYKVTRVEEGFRKDDGGNVFKVAVVCKKDQDEPGAGDAVLWKGRLGIIEGQDAEMSLLLTVRLGQTVSGIRQAPDQLIVCASLLAARRAYEALNWYQNANLAVNPVLRALCMEEQPQCDAPRRDAPVGLNRSQAEAFFACTSLRQGVVLCQGPPGTGKTTFTVELLHSVISSSTKVLVCGPSNKAVHVVVERFRRSRPSISVVFVGNRRTPLPPLVEDVYVDSFFDSVAARLSSAVNANDPKRVILVCDDIRTFKIAATTAYTDVMRECMTLSYGRCWKCAQNLHMECGCGAWRGSISVANLVAALVACDKTELVERAYVVFMTLATSGGQSVRKWMERFRFDWLLVDEAAQASEPELLIPLYTNPSRCVLIGDPQQLPPTVISNNAATAGYGVSTMERLTHNGFPRHLLTEQYRMMPDIRKWPSDTFYGGLIHDNPSVLSRGDAPPPFVSLPRGCRALLRCGGRETSDGTSWSNKVEAEAVANVVSKLGLAGDRVGVITFYAAQKTLIARYLQDCPGVLVSTVDGFQGGEKDVIVISFVRSGSHHRFLEDAKRLNVCVTRAKFYMVAITSLEVNLPPQSLLCRLFASFAPHQTVSWRGGDVELAAVAAQMQTLSVRSTAAPKPGDWICAKCRATNSRRQKDACYKCKAPKEPLM